LNCETPKIVMARALVLLPLCLPSDFIETLPIGRDMSGFGKGSGSRTGGLVHVSSVVQRNNPDYFFSFFQTCRMCPVPDFVLNSLGRSLPGSAKQILKVSASIS